MVRTELRDTLGIAAGRHSCLDTAARKHGWAVEAPVETIRTSYGHSYGDAQDGQPLAETAEVEVERLLTDTPSGQSYQDILVDPF